MKKFAKICLVTGSIFVLIGGSMAAAAAIMGGNLLEIMPQRAVQWKNSFHGMTLEGNWGDYEDFNDEEYKVTEGEGQEIYSSSQVENLDIDAESGKVIFVEDSQGDKIRVLCNRDERYWNLTGEEEDLKLQVLSDQKEINGDSGLMFTIYVPRDYHFSSVRLRVSHSGSPSGWKDSPPIILAQSLSADEMNLETKAGAIVINGGDVGDLNLVCDVGAVKFAGTTSGDIDGQCRVGALSLVLSGKKTDYDYDIRCKMGSVQIGEEEIAAFNSRKRDDNKADKTMNLECKTGGIQIDFMNEI